MKLFQMMHTYVADARKQFLGSIWKDSCQVSFGVQLQSKTKAFLDREIKRKASANCHILQ